MTYKRFILIAGTAALMFAGLVYIKAHGVHRSQKEIREVYLAKDGDKIHVIVIWGHEALHFDAQDVIRLKLGNVSWSERIENTYVTVWTIDKEVFEGYTESGLHNAYFVVPYKDDVYLALTGYARGAYMVTDGGLHKMEEEKSEEILSSMEAVKRPLHVTNDGSRLELLVTNGKLLEGAEEAHRFQLNGRTVNVELNSISPKGRVTAITVTVDGVKREAKKLKFKPKWQPISSDEWTAMRTQGALSSEELLTGSATAGTD